MTEYVRYRDFITYLEMTAAEDDTMRVLENRCLAETCGTWLSLVPGLDGGVAFVRSRKNGNAPLDAGVMVKIDPTVMITALAAALAKPEMMALARSILTPGQFNLCDVGLFSDGLKDLPMNPFQDDTVEGSRPTPTKKPPSLDIGLWRRIPHAQRRDFIVAMAAGLRRGLHPDDTVSSILSKSR
ncbi:hypothetical protein [Rhizobium sp. NXC24]|uniref:hypothetical protein n=1 Tax=Rhizobium sp. NXC24 TaxID=2048897 RepID=UPI000CDF5533|nr:hypothetical protein [Rhizobium sp. NXC24]AVA21960.1 hypothetical protein NXC24_CH02323 [Rhizobium sp. NXC24]